MNTMSQTEDQSKKVMPGDKQNRFSFIDEFAFFQLPALGVAYFNSSVTEVKFGNMAWSYSNGLYQAPAELQINESYSLNYHYFPPIPKAKSVKKINRPWYQRFNNRNK